MATYRTSGEVTPRENDEGELLAIRSMFATALRELPESFAAVEASAQAVEIPVHLFWGERDPFFDLSFGRRVAEVLRADLTVVSGVGHHAHLEAPDEVAAAVKRFVDAFAPGDLVVEDNGSG